MTETAPQVRNDEPAQPVRRVVVLADDLIWASRLSDAITAAGANPHRVRRLADLAPALGSSAEHVVIDLTALAYDGLAAIRVAVALGARVVAVGQHDNVPLRQAAIEAGAERVYTYRALFEHGARVLATWLGR